MLLTRVDGGLVVGRVDPEVYNQIRRIEDKIRGEYADAEFELLCGPDDALHLKVFTNDDDLWGPLALVEHDLIDLQARDGLNLHLIPLRFEDKEETEETPLDSSNAQSHDDSGGPPTFLRNADSV
jgi:hypothetical protein